MDWIGKNFCQANAQAYEEIRRNNASLKAHALHTMEDKHEHKRHIAEWDKVGIVEMMWEQKRQMQRGLEWTHKGRSTSHLY